MCGAQIPAGPDLYAQCAFASRILDTAGVRWRGRLKARRRATWSRSLGQAGALPNSQPPAPIDWPIMGTHSIKELWESVGSADSAITSCASAHRRAPQIEAKAR